MVDFFTLAFLTFFEADINVSIILSTMRICKSADSNLSALIFIFVYFGSHKQA